MEAIQAFFLYLFSGDSLVITVPFVLLIVEYFLGKSETPRANSIIELLLSFLPGKKE